MNGRRLAVIAVAAALVVGLGWAMFAFLGRRLAEPTPDAEPTAAASQASPASAGPQIAATIYFASEDGASLVGVQQDVPLGETPVAQARALVEAQLAAEPPPPLARAVPAGITLRGVFVPGDDAYVDLDATVRTAVPGGSHNEMMAVYALVSVLTTNLSPIARVQILVDGREVDTLTGHVDLREPLRKNEGLIRTP